MPGAGCSTAVPIGAEVAACPFTTSTLLRIATVSPGTATRRLISRTPSLGEEKVTMSPRRGSPRWATTMSVSGAFRSKASRVTSTTAPSSSVGRIDPDGMGFQSATAVRKRPKSTRKTMKPLLFRIHLGMPGPRLLVRELKSLLLQTRIVRFGSNDARCPAACGARWRQFGGYTGLNSAEVSAAGRAPGNQGAAARFARQALNPPEHRGAWPEYHRKWP